MIVEKTMREKRDYMNMTEKIWNRFALGERLQILMVLIALMFCNTTVAQSITDTRIGTPKLIQVTVQSDGKLAIHKNGAPQLKNLEDWFCLLVQQGATQTKYRTARDVSPGGFTYFALTDVDAQTAGRHQSVTKRCSSFFKGAEFYVDYTVSYDTLNPEIIMSTVLIDASKLPANTTISLAAGADIQFQGTCDAGGAYVAPNNYGRNYTTAFVSIKDEEIDQLKFYGGKSITEGGQLKGFLRINRPFSHGSVQRYIRTKGTTFLTQAFNGMEFHLTYDLTDSECRTPSMDLGIAYIYKDIRGNAVTSIQTGMLFSSDIVGGLDYSWTNSFESAAKHKTVIAGSVTDLTVRYDNYTVAAVHDVGFDLHLAGLKIAGKCKNNNLTGAFDCFMDSDTYSMRGASLDNTYVDIVIPVKALQTGVYEIDAGAFTNTKKALPAGSTATLTVNSEVNFASPLAYPLAGSQIPVRIELPAGTSEPVDIKVELQYSEDTVQFSPRPRHVIIPAGQNFVEFMLQTPGNLSTDTKMDIAITGTDHLLVSPGAKPTMQIVICRAVLKDDVVASISTQTVIDMLANDLMLPCNRNEITIKTEDVHTQRGVISLNADMTITYAANSVPAIGIDSFRYVIQCPVPSISECSNAAWVYLVTMKALAQKYIACTNAEITVGMMPVPGVSYHWYDAPVNGNLIRANSDTCDTRKSSAPADTLYVEAEYRGVRMARYPLVIERSEYCSDTPPPLSCAMSGQLIFSEDFGGNSLLDPTVSLIPLPDGTTSYRFDTLQHARDIPADNRYSISKIIADSNIWHTYGDHTSAATTEAGYLMAINGTDTNRMIYSTKIDGLCAGMTLSFSAWIGNLLKPDPNGNELYPRMIFTVHDLATNKLLAEYATGDIPSESTPVWKLYGCRFVPESDSVRLSIFSQTPANTATGNDFVIDDIELRLCVPRPDVVPFADTTVCSGSNVRLKLLYADNGTYSQPLLVRWEYNPTGADSAWTQTQEDTFPSATANSNFDIAGFTGNNIGYYRMTVGDSLAIDRPRCRIEHLAKIDTFQLFHAADIRIRPLAEEVYDTTIINLSRYISTVNHKYVKWENYLALDPDIDDLATGSIEARKLKPKTVYTYRYRLDAPCNISFGKAYVQLDSLQNCLPKKTKTLVVCRSDESSSAIILENVAGVSMDGSWTSKQPDPDDVLHKTVSTDNEYSTNIFNAQKAYDEAHDPVYDDVYDGKQAKVITFTLEVPSQSSIPDELMDLKIVITD